VLCKIKVEKENIIAIEAPIIPAIAKPRLFNCSWVKFTFK
jgi:hypothetical protein